MVSKTNKLKAKKRTPGVRKWLQLKKFSLNPSSKVCLDMEQFVLVLVSVWNRSLIKQSVTQQKFLKCQPSKNPTYQIGSLKKEINKKLFAKADSLVDKILSCPRIKPSNSQTS